MAEEVKTQNVAEGKKSSDAVKMVSKIVLGLLFVALGLAAVIRWIHPLLMIVKGCVGLFLILVGIITVAVAKE
ncbi:MAG: hypothetical protein WCI77_08355 [Candidatus Omnitrophota bacterium]